METHIHNLGSPPCPFCCFVPFVVEVALLSRESSEWNFFNWDSRIVTLAHNLNATMMANTFEAVDLQPSMQQSSQRQEEQMGLWGWLHVKVGTL